MKKQFILSVFSIFFAFGAFAQQPLNSAVHFETAKAELTQEAKTNLLDFSNHLKSFGDYSLEIKAHTDSRGSNTYNMDLSNRRANAVMNFLTENGIESHRSTATAFGESRPEFSNQTDEGMQKNRRVDLIGTVYTIDDLALLLDRLSANDVQEFHFAADEDMRLTARNGTTVLINANSFETLDGQSVTGDITFKMEEAYNDLDIIAKGLSTLSNDQMLETGGMIYMEAEANNQPLHLKDSKNLIVEMPTAQQKQGMELFMGESTTDEIVNWQPTGQPFATNTKSLLQLPPRPKMINYKTISFKPYNCPLPKIKTPKKPRKPIEPREPKRSEFQYNPSFFKKLKLGKTKIEDIEQKKYEEALARYKTRKERYENRYMPNYAADLKKHEEQMTVYQNQVADRDSICHIKGDKYYNFYREKNRKIDSIHTAKHHEQLKIWREVREKKIQAFENSTEVNTDSRSLRAYVFNVSQLGWINCDRFRNTPEEELMAVSIESTSTIKNEMVYIIFKDGRSAIRPRKSGQFYVQKNLPLGEEVAIVGIKVKNGRPQLAILDSKIQQENKFKLNYENATLKEIRNAVNGLRAS